MKKEELRPKLLLSAQRALWGMIYPEIRAIAVGGDERKLKVIYYLDRKPNENDFENISEVVGLICADIEFQEVEEVCLKTNESISNLDNLDSWVYVRYEK